MILTRVPCGENRSESQEQAAEMCERLKAEAQKAFCSGNGSETSAVGVHSHESEHTWEISG
jgi:hypothetical protein